MKAIRYPFALAIAASLALQVTAKQPVSDGKTTAGKMETPMAETNFGRITLGGKFSEDLQSGYVDYIGGGFIGSNTAVFANFRGTFDDNVEPRRARSAVHWLSRELHSATRPAPTRIQ